jgi:hypothetical protein
MVSYLRGLLSETERKNGWTLAESAGDTGPQGMQRLLNHYLWDVDALRDDVRDAVAEHIGDPDRGVLILDETGFLKKGVRSADVGRQYSGTAGRIENSQIGVLPAYGSDQGRALIDRELYLPKDWTSDRERCRAAGIGDEIEFATKPDIGLRMLKRASRNCRSCPADGWPQWKETIGTCSSMQTRTSSVLSKYVIRLMWNGAPPALFRISWIACRSLSGGSSPAPTAPTPPARETATARSAVPPAKAIPAQTKGYGTANLSVNLVDSTLMPTSSRNDAFRVGYAVDPW